MLVVAAFTINLLGCREGSGNSSLGLLVGPTQTVVTPTEGFAIEGIIKNNDPKQSLGNVSISLYNSNHVKVAQTNTTVEGRFYFYNQPADFYQIRIDEDGLIMAPSSYYLRLLPEGVTSPETITIDTQSRSSGGTISTYAITGALRNKAEPEKGAAYVLVELFQNERLLQIQQSTADGQFYFSGLATGTYRFMLARGSDQYMIRDDVIFELQPGGVTVPPISLLLLEPKVGDTGGKQITGLLTNENNSLSVGNIRVVLRRDGVTLGDTFTTAEGRFFFFDRTPDFYEIQVQPTSYFASATSYIRMLPDGTTSPADIRIPLILLQDEDALIPTYGISGKVKNARDPEEVVPFILVELFKSNVLQQVQQTTSAGDFNFLGLATGSYKLSLGRGSEIFIEKDDVIFDMLENGVAAPPVNLIFIEPKEIASASYQIAGLVKSGKSGLPLSNIQVLLTREDTTLTETTTTTSEGKFFFFDRTPGFYELKIVQSALYYATTSYIRILPDGTISPAMVEMVLDEIVDPDESKRTYTVLGTVKDRSKPEEVVPFTLVELVQGTTLLAVQQSSATGGFMFEGLRPGQYRLTFARGSDQFQFRDDVVFEILTNGVIAPPVTLVFLEPKEIDVKYSVSGLVVLGTTNEPLTGIKVELWKDAIAGTALKSTFTTGEGRFSFSNLDVGLYFTRVGSGQTVYRVRDDYIIQVSDDGTISPEESLIKLSKDLSEVQAYLDLKGYIRDAFTGAPLEYVTINLKGYGNVLTDRLGYYFFKDIPAGVYDMELSKPGFSPLTVSIQVVLDETTDTLSTLPGTLDYYMIYNQETNKGSIAGRVVNPDDGTPLSDKIVRVYKMAYATQEKTLVDINNNQYTITETDWDIIDELLVSTRTGSGLTDYDDTGTFKITHLEPGSYLVYIGENNSKPVFKDVSYLYPGEIYWTIEDKSMNANRIHSWSRVSVTANTTTYLTTYDTEKR